MTQLVVCIFLILGLLTGQVFAMSSVNFKINWDNINEGGLDVSTSTNFGMRDTIGDNASGISSSSNYRLSAGYRANDALDALSFVLKGEDATTETAFSAFSSAGKTVVVASTSTFAVGDYIAVVENKGFGQLVAVGKISDIVGLTLSVDGWDGDQASISAIPAGGDDFVYRLSTNTAAFGTVTAGVPNTSVTVSSVGTNIATGYSVYIQGNQLLENTLFHPIVNVSDGAVSIGSEEYGASVTGAKAFGAGTDTAVTTTQRVIQTSGAPSGVVPDRVAMTYKLSTVATTDPGTYSQNVFYTVTPNY